MFLLVLALITLGYAQNPPDFIKTHWDGSVAGCTAGANTYFLDAPRWYTDANVSATIEPFKVGDLDTLGLRVTIRVPFIPAYQNWFMHNVPMDLGYLPLPTICNSAAVPAFRRDYPIYNDRWNNQTLALQQTLQQYPFGRSDWDVSMNTQSAGLSSTAWSVRAVNCDTYEYLYKATYANMLTCNTQDNAKYFIITNTTDSNGNNMVTMKGKIQAINGGKYYNFATGAYDWSPTVYTIPWSIMFSQGSVIGSTSPSAFISFKSTTTVSDVQGTMIFCVNGVFSIPMVNNVTNNTNVYINPTLTETPSWLSSTSITNTPSAATQGMNHPFSVCVYGTCKYGAGNCTGPLKLNINAQNGSNGNTDLGYQQPLSVFYPQVVNPVTLVTRWKTVTSQIYKVVNSAAVFPTIWQEGDYLNMDAAITTLGCTGAATDCALDPTKFTTSIYSAAICISNNGVVPVITSDAVTGCYLMDDYTMLADNGVVSTNSNIKGYYTPSIATTNSALTNFAWKARLYLYSSTKSAYLKYPSPVQYIHIVVNVLYRGSSKRGHILVRADDSENALGAQNSYEIEPSAESTEPTATKKELTPGNVVWIILGSTIGFVLACTGCFFLVGMVRRKRSNRRYDDDYAEQTFVGDD
jgi:hypothetical protein